VLGVTPDPESLVVTDLIVPVQFDEPAWTEFCPSSLQDILEVWEGAGWEARQFMRVWIHSHPGTSAHPSGQDEAVFRETFGLFDWAVMAIAARGGDTYAKVQSTIRGLRLEQTIPFLFDMAPPYGVPADLDQQLERLYSANVRPKVWPKTETAKSWSESLIGHRVAMHLPFINQNGVLCIYDGRRDKYAPLGRARDVKHWKKLLFVELPSTKGGGRWLSGGELVKFAATGELSGLVKDTPLCLEKIDESPLLIG